GGARAEAAGERSRQRRRRGQRNQQAEGEPAEHAAREERTGERVRVEGAPVEDPDRKRAAGGRRPEATARQRGQQAPAPHRGAGGQRQRGAGGGQSTATEPPAGTCRARPRPWLAPLPGAQRRAAPGGAARLLPGETCWKVVTEISGIVALWCSVSEHVIKQASREANRLWGSSMLEGKSVFSLANGPSSASWLKKAFQSHQRIADMGQTDRGIPGFIVRDLGSETFASKNGDPFDASVITAHFAAEPGCGRPGGVLVILERLELKPALGGSAAHAAGFAEGAQPSRPRTRGARPPRGATAAGTAPRRR
ncbi:unnamed protein product, partial [Prorocentrum cordatum]